MSSKYSHDTVTSEARPRVKYFPSAPTNTSTCGCDNPKSQFHSAFHFQIAPGSQRFSVTGPFRFGRQVDIESKIPRAGQIFGSFSVVLSSADCAAG